MITGIRNGMKILCSKQWHLKELTKAGVIGYSEPIEKYMTVPCIVQIHAGNMGCEWYKYDLVDVGYDVTFEDLFISSLSEDKTFKVLKWIMENYTNSEFEECFGHNLSFMGLHNLFTPAELVIKVLDYINVKKETKFGWEYSCNIFKIDPLQKLLVKEIKIESDSDDDLTDFDLQTKAEKLLEDYVKNHPGEYEATIVKSYKMKR